MGLLKSALRWLHEAANWQQDAQRLSYEEHIVVAVDCQEAAGVVAEGVSVVDALLLLDAQQNIWMLLAHTNNDLILPRITAPARVSCRVGNMMLLSTYMIRYYDI